MLSANIGLSEPSGHPGYLPVLMTGLLEHLEEILVVRRVRFTLRQQLHECLSPEQGRVVGQLLK